MTSLIVVATASLLANAVQAKAPAVTLSNVRYSNGCRAARGAPSSTFSPDNRVVSILFQGLSAERRQVTQRRESELTCRISVDAQLPSGMRGQFTAADYRFSLLTSGGGRAEFSVRHGRAGFLLNRWSSRATRTMAPVSGETIAPGGQAVTIGCAQKATLLLEIRLRASGSTNADEAVATVDSIDFDAGLPADLSVEPCR